MRPGGQTRLHAGAVVGSLIQYPYEIVGQWPLIEVIFTPEVDP